MTKERHTPFLGLGFDVVREKGEKEVLILMKIFMCDDILGDAKEKERERKTSLIIVTPLLLLNVVVIFFVVFVLCVNFYLLQIKKADENKLVVRVSVAYFIVLLRGQLQKRQSVQLDASTVIGQFGAQLAHRDASVLF